jgi:multiple sugar transport system permease protein
MRGGERGRGGARRREALRGWLFVAPWVVGFLGLTAGPMLFSLYVSFTRSTLLSPPVWTGLENYATLFGRDELVAASFGNTLAYTALSVPGSVALALALAVLLNRPLRGIAFFRTLFFLPSVTNVVAVAVLWMWVFNPEFGLANLALGWLGLPQPLWLQSETWAKPALVLMSFWNVGGMMIVFLAALQQVPQELLEAAALDGASAPRRFVAVTLPMISPALLFNTVMSVIGSFQVFTQAFVMSGGAQPGSEGGPANATLFYVLYIYKKAFQEFSMGYAAALAWVLFAVIAAGTALLMRATRSRVFYEAGEGR